jgi:hypothetical protein
VKVDICARFSCVLLFFTCLSTVDTSFLTTASVVKICCNSYHTNSSFRKKVSLSIYSSSLLLLQTTKKKHIFRRRHRRCCCCCCFKSHGSKYQRTQTNKTANTVVPLCVSLSVQTQSYHFICSSSLLLLQTTKKHTFSSSSSSSSLLLLLLFQVTRK